ncbi:MAG: 6-hydroxymethylpterin diphosphokinase MptE-like protein, partial [Phycisphaerales bacterium]
MNSVQTPIPTDVGATLRANLEAIARRSPRAARAILDAQAHPGVEWAETDQGPVCLLNGRALASRRRPADEAERIADGVDPKEAGVFAVVGFGSGHHVRAIAARTRRAAALLVFEPDVALLRAVLERVDCSAWIASNGVCFLTDPTDGGAITRALEGAEPLVALGLKIVEHPPSRVRLAGEGAQFGRTLTQVVAAVRTVVVTTMVQTEVTMRNTLLNLDRYLAASGDRAGGVADLAGLCAGRPAVVVSAGPSLARTIDALAAPGVRDRVVIIAVQTALKPLLAKGVRPHFVTALDYHEISRRFYEGLTAEGIAGVTLVAEPKVNPVVPESFPGPVRCPGDDTLDLLLGADLAGEHGTLPAGSTVAHLAYYLARHLGCDPVILTGQDLGFTDGQYYGAGAAIHDAWAPELGSFTTLEMYEWERIARGKKTLRPMTDQRGRRIYSDEQMATYLAQFERDFGRDADRGLRTIDATEGGVAKRNAAPMGLAEAIAQFAPSDPLPAIPTAPAGAAPETLAQARERLDAVRRDAGRIGALSRRTGALLDDLRAALAPERPDEKKVNRIIGEVHRLRDEAHGLEPAFSLVQRLNQTGAFNRSRTDRAIALEDDLDAREKQRRQVARDAENVRWLADSAESLARMLDGARAALDGGPKRTHIESRPDDTSRRPAARERARVGALLIEDLATDDASLRGTIERAGRAERIDRVVVLTSDEARARTRLAGIDCDIVASDLDADLARLERIRRARRFSLGAWRGGVAALTCYDEHCAALPSAAALERLGLDAGVVLGADWSALDPALLDALVERHEEHPAQHRVVFTQAAPGLAGCLIDRGLLFDLGAAIATGNVMATIGGALRYIPTSPAPDPIARPICVPIETALRDRVRASDAPTHLALELTTRRTDAGGLRGAWLGLDGAPVEMDAARGVEIVREFADRAPAGCVTLAGRGDPLLHPEVDRIASAALEAGLALHVRTDLACGEDAPERLLALGADVVSVDLYATEREAYAVATGSANFDAIVRRMERLCQGRDVSCGVPRPWVVPRITRCDALLESIEGFYDGWLNALGCA